MSVGTCWTRNVSARLHARRHQRIERITMCAEPSPTPRFVLLLVSTTALVACDSSDITHKPLTADFRIANSIARGN